MFQVSTPSHLPTASFSPKQEVTKLDFTPPLAEFRKLTTNVPAVTNPQHVPVSSIITVSPPVGDDDEELDQLLSIKKPDSGNQETGEDGENTVAEKGG